MTRYHKRLESDPGYTPMHFATEMAERAERMTDGEAFRTLAGLAREYGYPGQIVPMPADCAEAALDRAARTLGASGELERRVFSDYVGTYRINDGPGFPVAVVEVHRSRGGQPEFLPVLMEAAGKDRAVASIQAFARAETAAAELTRIAPDIIGKRPWASDRLHGDDEVPT